MGAIQHPKRGSADNKQHEGLHIYYTLKIREQSSERLTRPCYKRLVTGEALTLGGGIISNRVPSRDSGRICILGKDAQNPSKNHVPPPTLTLDHYIILDPDEQGWAVPVPCGSTPWIPYGARVCELCQGKDDAGRCI